MLYRFELDGEDGQTADLSQFGLPTSLSELIRASFGSEQIPISLPGRLYLLEEGGLIISTLLITSSYRYLPMDCHAIPNCWYIYDVCTHRDHRRKGHMRRLLQQLLRELPSGGMVFLRVAPNNYPARNLYLSLDFKEQSYEPGAILMMRTI